MQKIVRRAPIFLSAILTILALIIIQVNHSEIAEAANNNCGTKWKAVFAVDGGGTVFKGSYDKLYQLTKNACDFKVIRKKAGQFGSLHAMNCSHVVTSLPPGSGIEGFTCKQDDTIFSYSKGQGPNPTVKFMENNQEDEEESTDNMYFIYSRG